MDSPGSDYFGFAHSSRNPVFQYYGVNGSGTQTIALRVNLNNNPTDFQIGFLDNGSDLVTLKTENTNGFALKNATSTSLTADANSNVTVGKASLGDSATNGYAYMPSCDGLNANGTKPTPTSKTGFYPQCWDGTAHLMCVYDGAWRCF